MKLRCQSFWFVGSVFLFCLVTTSPLRAQIVPDATLPNPSIVTTNGNTSAIAGGTQAGSNLFHSFREFSVPTNGVASFQQIDKGIENVISRVTGSSVSNIDGLITVLEANGTVSKANFFLINPNGIIFGSNAQLSIGGSILASTAHSVSFADGSQFSATASSTTPLLTVSVPIGLQFGGTTPGSIRNQSQAINSSGDIGGLQVQPGKTLALVGGDVVLEGGSLTAEGGRIELGSVAGTGLVSLNPTDKGWALGYEGVQNFQDIQLSQQAYVNASGAGGGDIQVQAAQLELMQGSFIFADTLGAEAGGEVLIQSTEALTLSDGSLIAADVFGSGTGGNLTIETGQLMVRDGARVQVATVDAGSGGTLSVTASDSVELVGGTVADGGFIPSGLFATAEAGATGAGGNLSISAGKLIVRSGAQVSSTTSSVGRAGDLSVTASNSVELVGGTVADGSFIPSGLFTTTVAEATGAGGNLSISAGKLIVRSGAEVSSTTSSVGRAGDLTVTAQKLIVQSGAQVNSTTSSVGRAGDLTVTASDSVELVGGIVAADGGFIPSGLFTRATAEATGVGGNLSIFAGKLIVRSGAQVSSTTSGVGRAGDLTVRAKEVELVGDALSADGELLTNERGLPFPSGLFAGTGIDSRGDGGTLTVETERLSLRDGAVVQTSTLGEGDAGDLTVQASESVEVIGKAFDGQFPSSLLAVSGGIPGFPGVFEAKGQGGNLRIETGEFIVQDGAAVAVSSLNPASDALGAGDLQVQAQTIHLENLGQLTSETSSGQGGNITLLVQDFLLLDRNSEISTTAGTARAGGNGGNITIDNSPFIVAVPFSNSDIKANAFLGQGGKITINAESIFGLAQRNLKDLQTLLGTNDPKQLDPINLPSSDITAISQTNPQLSGQVTINTPDVDPTQGLVALPEQVVDVSGLIAQGCSGGGGLPQSEFIVTGRGGLPPNPSEPLSSDTVWSDLRTQERAGGVGEAGEAGGAISGAEGQRGRSGEEKIAYDFPPAPSAPSAPSALIVEATGWVINNKGEVVLTATAPAVVPHSPWQVPASCSGS